MPGPVTAGQILHGGKSGTLSGSKGERFPLGGITGIPTSQQAPTVTPAKKTVFIIIAYPIFQVLTVSRTEHGEQGSVSSAIRQMPGAKSGPTTYQ